MSILRTLTRFEMTSAKDAFVTIFPGSSALDIEGYLTQTFQRIPLEPAIGLRLAIWFIALAPLFLLRRARTFHGLGADDRERVLALLAMNPFYAVRQLVLGLKAWAALFYAGNANVRARILTRQPLAETIPLRRKASESPLLPKEGSHAARVA